MNIALESIDKAFGNRVVLGDVNCDFAAGDFVTLLGPSGCGKTTLLRLIAGLEQPDRGAIFFDGFNTKHWSVQERLVGFVFQHYALFPHLSAFDNIAFGLRMGRGSRKFSTKEIQKRVYDLLDSMHLAPWARSFPRQLSGGQKQRVALARALAIEPRVLLLDEPFAALDAPVRQELRDLLRSMQKRLGVTCILVTHDQDEAMELSQTIVLLKDGKIEQVGPPASLYDQPASLFSMKYMSAVNQLPIQVLGTDDGSKGFIYVRVHDFELSTNLAWTNQAKVVSAAVRGGKVHLDLEALGARYSGPLRVEVSREQWLQLEVGEGQIVSWSVKRYKYFDTRSVILPLSTEIGVRKECPTQE